MSIAVHTVDHNAREVEPWVVISESTHECPKRGCLATGIHHQNHGEMEKPSDRGCTAFLRTANAIEESHDAFDESHGAVPAIAMEGFTHPWLPAKIEIEVAAGTPRRLTQQLRVEVIGPHFERLNRLTACPSPAQEGKADEGFAAATGRCGNHNGHGVLPKSTQQLGRQRCRRRQERVGAVVATAEQSGYVHFWGGVLHGNDVFVQVEVGHAAPF
jgi:hypothetical protein